VLLELFRALVVAVYRNVRGLAVRVHGKNPLN
jgi:hypothetical protein